MSALREAQDRAIDDAILRWSLAQAALDAAQAEAETLHDAKPQLLDDDSFYEFLGAIGGMQRILADLISEIGAP